MMLLPQPPRRAEQKAFWIVFCAGLGLLTGVLLGVLANPAWGLVAAMVMGALSGIGFAFRPPIALVYRHWNRAARKVSRLAERVLLAGCYFVVFAGLRLTGAGLKLNAENGGGWQRRETIPPDAYVSQHAGKAGPRGGQGWLRAYAGWTVSTGHVWALCLVPFLVLLRWVRAEEPRQLLSNIYTLF